jgi:tetrahydromethanopterin S-methyltransferase subunit G
MNTEERLEKIEKRLDDIQSTLKQLFSFVVHINEKILDQL